jgi:hypothetical protein
MIKTPVKAVCLFKIAHMEEKSLEEKVPCSLNKTMIFPFLTAAAKTGGAPHHTTPPSGAGTAWWLLV